MPEPITTATATGYAAAGGFGGGLGAATMLAFIKPKTAWSGVIQIAMGVTWGTFGGKTLADVVHAHISSAIDSTSYFHIAWCGILLGSVIYALLGAVSRYFLRLERQDVDVVEMWKELKELRSGSSGKKPEQSNTNAQE